MPVEAVFFNVGQGDCTLLWFYDWHGNVKKGKHAILIDCGSTGPVPHHGAPPSSATPKDQLVERLRSKIGGYLANLPTPDLLDCLIITHPDEDHFNLLRDVLEGVNPQYTLNFSIDRILYGLDLRDYKDRTEFLERLFDNWQRFEDLNGRKAIKSRPEVVSMPSTPVALLPGTGANLYLVGAAYDGGDKPAKFESGPKEPIANMSSLVTVLVDDGPVGSRQKVLLMADAVALNEQCLEGAAADLVKREGELWLKLGHHGSNTSTTDDWLDYTKPSGLFVSTGVKKFRGSATCRVKNMNRVMPYWNNVRAKNRIGLPVATVPASCGYVAQDDRTGPNGPFVHTPAQGIFSSMAVPSQEGVDWHLTLDANEPNGYAISFA
ncbi:ComEC/Rec2 family competence protein [Streptomyces sp. NPDC020379]|uniref:ComEC/Rec2 family competence protein n=1 Tax=Streptomyces sp. NPDC020379 TaxID=3365071 RepID=UPI00378F7578